jgi:hypothetical protein
MPLLWFVAFSQFFELLFEFFHDTVLKFRSTFISDPATSVSSQKSLQALTVAATVVNPATHKAFLLATTPHT